MKERLEVVDMGLIFLYSAIGSSKYYLHVATIMIRFSYNHLIKEASMNFSRNLGFALLAGLLIFISVPANADDSESNPIIKPIPVPESAKKEAPAPAAAPALAPKKVEVSVVPAECAGISNSDRQNLCLAKTGIDKDKKYGYENKDHRNYYCSIIKERDLQTYCYAVVGKKASSCDLIVDPGIEKECKASF